MNRTILILSIYLFFVISISSSVYYVFFDPLTPKTTLITQKHFEDLFFQGKIKRVLLYENEELILIYPTKEESDEILEMLIASDERFTKEFDDLKKKGDPNNRVEFLKTSDRLPILRSNTKEFLILLFQIWILLTIYFIPSFIARNKSFFNQILALNIFLGFTFIGWVASLVWSLKKEEFK